MNSFFKTNIQPSDIEVVNKLVADLKIFISETLKQQSVINIALSGGSTPLLLFKVLAENQLNALPWENLHFFWVDERCVPHESDESNYGNAYRILFNKSIIPHQHIHAVLGANLPSDEVIRYSAEIELFVPLVNHKPQFDLILLGMGPDGHTASIFPGQEVLFKSEKVCEISQHPETGQKRITLTGNILNNAKEIVFLVTGKNKADKVKHIFTADSEVIYPAQFVKPVHGNVSWYLDEDAGKYISQSI